MLFHPRKPVYFLSLKIQGILPRRQPDIAVQLGQIVAEDLLSSEDLADQLTSDKSRALYDDFIDVESEKFIKDKLRRMGPIPRLLLRSKTLAKLKAEFSEELILQLPILIERLTQAPTGSLDVQTMVENRVNELSTDRLEKILYGILAKEFKFIEILGAALGFIIGLLQLGFILLTQ